MKYLLTILIAAWAINVSAQETSATTQQRRRPQFDATHPGVHDPVMARGEDGRYYLFATGMGVDVLSSADMKTWQRERAVFEPAPAWAEDSVPGYRGHTWAPDISYHDGQWLLYYSCSTFGKNTSAIGLISSRSLAGGIWKDEGCMVASKAKRDNWNAIDPNFVIDEETAPVVETCKFVSLRFLCKEAVFPHELLK